MPTATPVNPRKKFPWTVEFEGLEPALVQQVTIPTVSVEVAEHGSSNILVKTGGMVKIGDIELKKLMFMDKSETWAYDWLKSMSNPEDGTMGVPSEYKRNGYIIFHDTDLETVLEKWQVIGCFPKEIEKDELDRTSSDDIIEKVVLSCDRIVRSS